MAEMMSVLRFLLLLQASSLVFSVNLSTFRNLYARMPELRLSAPPSRVVSNISTEECARTCVEEAAFECKSFDVDNLYRTCLLFNTSYEEGQAFLQESRHVDHYRSAFEKLFNRLPNHVITVAHKRKVPDVSVEQCARRCIFEMTFRCEGFDYEPQHQNCWLTDLTVETGGGVKYHVGADFYERVLDGPVSKFVNYGVGSLPVIDGYQIYGKVMFGVTLGACAQLCLTQTTFDCSSFDYSFSDRACHMSQYIAANLNGLNHDVMPTYRVVHYEKKGKYLNYFYPTPYTIVLGRNDKILTRVKPDRCARNCLEETDFVCRSFDYQIQNGTCLLSAATGSDVGRLYYQGQQQAHHFEMKPFLDCGDVLTDVAGDFASPNWPRHYEHHLNCTWHVQVPRHKVITFNFVHFDLGPQSANPCDAGVDRLVITEMTSHGLVRFCASSPMRTYVSHSNEVALQFITNDNVDAQGFRVFYTGDWPCKALLTEDNGQIASPGWPAQYPRLLDCTWTIQAPTSAKVFLQFSAIDLDGPGFGRCTEHYDYLEVYDGDSPASTKLAMLCGHDPVTSYTSRHNVLLVKLKTDKHVQRTGFHATYRFIFPTTSTVSTTATTSTSNTTANTTSTTTQEDPEVQKMTSLTAHFVEPHRDVRREWTPSTWSPSNSTPHYNFNEDGGAFSGPFERQSSPVSVLFVRTMWTLVISLLMLLVLLIVVLFAVCRHYRKKFPKKRNIPNYTFTDEDLSLYEKETLTSVSTREIDSLTYKFHSDPDPDIAFSNPLYESRYPAPSQNTNQVAYTAPQSMTSFPR
ncbi:uncharacterized protein LOC112575994 isoform X2 [Pomacea canaliculata]|uniref:uncharacterized protein LOC112575994 isoform X2 n=1 Tax=Pomacea canaliculata TaxID=400727 RepID=UPI000D725250|nr:uncharacterized protein LOC112575994 isoform X2 [Pomacea canaliculata]